MLPKISASRSVTVSWVWLKNMMYSRSGLAGDCRNNLWQKGMKKFSIQLTRAGKFCLLSIKREFIEIGAVNTIVPGKNEKSFGVYHLITVLGSTRSQSYFVPFRPAHTQILWLPSPWKFIPWGSPALKLSAQKLATFSVSKVCYFTIALTRKVNEAKLTSKDRYATSVAVYFLKLIWRRKHSTFRVFFEAKLLKLGLMF